MAKSGTILPVNEHLVTGCCYKSPVDFESLEDMVVDVKGKGKAVDKGKGKATYVDTGYVDMDLDNMMNDITNSEFLNCYIAADRLNASNRPPRGVASPIDPCIGSTIIQNVSLQTIFTANTAEASPWIRAVFIRAA